MKSAIIIPTYNEKENIKKIIPAIFSEIKSVSVIVVDDNSPDKTAMKVKELMKKYKHLFLIKRKQKAGRGSAVIEGFLFAYQKLKTDVFLEMDADFSHQPKELFNLIKSAKEKTVIIASRYVKGSKIINWPISRRITSKLANFLIRLILDLPIKDITNGFRCYPKKAVAILINHNFQTQGYITLSEIAYLLKQKGFQFLELPTIFINRKLGRSNASLREFFFSFLSLLKIKFANKN